MASPSFTTPAERRTPAPAAGPREGLLLVADLGNPAAADYVAYASRGGETNVAFAGASALPRVDVPAPVAAVVLFLGPRLGERERAVLDDLLALAAAGGAELVCVVSTFRVHLGDPDARAAEDHVLSRAQALPARTVVFRPGHVLSPGSRTSAFLRRFGACYPLVPGRLRGCCVEGDELFAAIEAERRGRDARRLRVYTLLGPNRPWRDLLARHRANGFRPACVTAACALLALLLVGQLAALLLGLLARRRPALRGWDFDTLRPRSLRELLALYNPYNHRHVKVVGYNNGVVHFGQSYPGKTVVSTVRCDRVVRAGPDVIKADCGATVRKARDFLAGAGQDLFVIPNYSYVCLGTAFFVPIHGSAADFSCVADTITRVVLYDPARDRLVVAGREGPAFRDHVYNQGAEVLLLRLRLRVKPRSPYYVHRQELDDPAGAEVLAALRDGRATNVEVRKARAASGTVQVCKYYKDPCAAQSPVLELPRDALGRLWDRLEEHAVTSFLMHALTRYFGWHVELFLTAEEFATFWETHRALPLHKIQLRHIRRDGFPHSPFREHDCVSADLFMFRRHRRAFEGYLSTTLPAARLNPGKHSR